MVTYQIADWNTTFENDRSRTRDKCSFVCVPNKQHGMGFCRIMSEPDGASIYGIWHMILGACSQQSLPRDGWLTDDGESAGSPWGVEDLSLKFRRPQSEIERALQVLTSERIAWVVSHSPSTHAKVTAKSPPSHLEGKEGKERREGERREGNGTLSPTDRISFEGELKRIGSELKERGSPKDYDRDDPVRQRISKLRERQTEIRERLGVVA